MRLWPNLIATLLLLAVPGATGAARTTALPPSGAVAGWSLQREPRKFTPANLYEYIDGAADLFLAYGFSELTAGEYAKAGGESGTITVDIYDMGSPLHAFGVFVSERPARPKALAGIMQTYSSDGLSAFWKGRYYVKVSAVEAGDNSAAEALAAATGKRLPGSAELPAEFKRLPAKGRIRGTERYVRKDALGHRLLTDVISADYRVGSAVATLHLADLATPRQAQQAWQKLRAFESQAGEGLAAVNRLGSASFAVRDSSYGDLVASHQGRFLVIAASEKAGRKQVVALAKGTLAGLQAKRRQPR